jgi:hypothetical protein
MGIIHHGWGYPTAMAISIIAWASGWVCAWGIWMTERNHENQRRSRLADIALNKNISDDQRWPAIWAWAMERGAHEDITIAMQQFHTSRIVIHDMEARALLAIAWFGSTDMLEMARKREFHLSWIGVVPALMIKPGIASAVIHASPELGHHIAPSDQERILQPLIDHRHYRDLGIMGRMGMTMTTSQARRAILEVTHGCLDDIDDVLDAWPSSYGIDVIAVAAYMVTHMGSPSDRLTRMTIAHRLSTWLERFLAITTWSCSAYPESIIPLLRTGIPMDACVRSMTSAHPAWISMIMDIGQGCHTEAAREMCGCIAWMHGLQADPPVLHYIHRDPTWAGQLKKLIQYAEASGLEHNPAALVSERITKSAPGTRTFTNGIMRCRRIPYTPWIDDGFPSPSSPSSPSLISSPITKASET